MKIIITEQQLNKLIENKDYVYGTYNGQTIETSNDEWDAIPFIYYNNRVYVGYNPELGEEYKENGYFDENGENNWPNFHSDISDFYKFIYSTNNNIPTRRDMYEYLGRIWYDREVISFWKYPNDINMLKKILSLLNVELKKIYNVTFNFENFLVDLNYNNDNELISVKDYIKGNDATEKEMQQQHTRTPMNKTITPQVKNAIQQSIDLKAKKFEKTPEYEWNFWKTKNLDEQKLIKNNLDNFYLENNINPDELSYLGKGDFGTAYTTGDGRVVKITTSKSEFDIAKQLENNYNKVLNAFAKIYKTDIIDGKMIIVVEELNTDDDIDDLYYELQNYLDEQGLPIQYVHMLDTDELNLSDEMIKFINEIDDINRAYRYLGIEASDLRPENLGYNTNGKLKAFDIEDKNKKR